MALSRASQPYREGRDNKGFSAFYRREIEPHLDEDERFRKKLVYVAAGWSVFLGAVAAWLVGGVWSASLGIVAFLLVAGGAMALSPRFFRWLGFQTALKRRIISRIASLIHPSLVYNPVGRVPQSEFADSALFALFNRYSGEDCFSGRIGETEIKFSELKVAREGRSPDGKRVTLPVFRGVFLVADFNKHFHGLTQLYPNRIGDALGVFGKTIQAMDFTKPGDLVQLEDAEFARNFVVYSTDQVEARYILTPSLMETLNRFRAQGGVRFLLSFAQSRLHMAFPMSTDNFEFSFFATLKRPEIYAEIYDDIRFFAGVVEQLNLNRRIWSKRPGESGDLAEPADVGVEVVERASTSGEPPT